MNIYLKIDVPIRVYTMAKRIGTIKKATPSFTVLSEVPETAHSEVPVAEPVEAAPVSEETTGRVKWFNNKAGYGFITVHDCETNEERDIFVHHSEVKVEQTQYKYLVQGEYVEFVIGAISRENKIDAHATSVRGVNGGKLMCETRNEARSYRTAEQPKQARQQAEQPRQQAEQSKQEQQAEQPRQAKQRRPQLEKADQTEWMVVPRRRTETITSKPIKQRQPAIEIDN